MPQLLLRRYAEKYETRAFLDGDPSWFMHQATGRHNQEATAFVAASLSYGNRQQFMQKIRCMAERAEGDIFKWVAEGRFKYDFPADDGNTFYRLHTYSDIHHFLLRLQAMLGEYGSMEAYMRQNACDGLSAVEALCRWFAAGEAGHVVPKDTQSACKRVCMFLRWMVRSGSPVDLGLWSDFIDRRTLIIPLDTHVLQQAAALGLIKSRTATMTTARRLTAKLAEVFPDDPLKGDFALFGHGVSLNQHTP